MAEDKKANWVVESSEEWNGTLDKYHSRLEKNKKEAEAVPLYGKMLDALQARIEQTYRTPNDFAMKAGVHAPKLYESLKGHRVPKATEFLRWFELLRMPVIVGPDLGKLNEHFVPVPKVSAKPRMGDGGLETDMDVEGFYAFRQGYLQRRAPGGSVVLMEAQGDSMRPTIEAGDMVLVDQGQCEIVAGRVYLVRIEDTLVIKRVDKAPGKMILRSDNPSYPLMEIDLAEVDGSVEVKGRVIWAAKEL
jgi:hypothetical protein